MSAMATNGSMGITAVELGEAAPVVIARRSGFFVCRDAERRRTGLAIATGDGADPAAMRQFLAGRLVAAWPEFPRHDTVRKAPDLQGYVYLLCSSYQTTHATPPTLRRARDSFLVRAALGDLVDEWRWQPFVGVDAARA
jgi:hypothetical protein